MINTNVVELEGFKFQKMQKLRQESYLKYLGTLQNSQLESEINFLLEEFSRDNQDDDFSLKVQLVQRELVNRADGEWKIKIAQMMSDPI